MQVLDITIVDSMQVQVLDITIGDITIVNSMQEQVLDITIVDSM